ncbi:MAG: histidine--tRNA ligase [Nanohaloarchaea archaeon SW_7_43_1]|nr:MAG: histidine--tRNA ligase [Nanohaloarchaea archaeon SW_7_43_1]
MTNCEKLKGFRDFYPDENAARQKVFDKIEKAVQSCAFRKIDSPAVEEVDLYRIKSGEGILDETFNFEDHGGREITLIPELTPTVARMIQNRKDLNKPIKWYSIPRCWRYESPQKGRLREFYQLNCDIIGSDNAKTDAELLYSATEVMRILNLEDSYLIRLNDRRLLESILESYGISKTEEVMKVIDDKEKLTKKEFKEDLTTLGLSHSVAEKADELTDISGKISQKTEEIESKIPEDKKAREAFERLENLETFLKAYNIRDKCRIDLSIVRGLDYYTGLVFEGFDSEGEYRAIFGGGRYNNYLQLFGNQELPAVGFGMGDAVLEEIMREKNKWPDEELSTDVYILNVDENKSREALKLTKELRKQEIRTEVNLSKRSFSNQLGYADNINAKYVVIVGDQTASSRVEVKSMDDGSEEIVEKSDLVSYIK